MINLKSGRHYIIINHNIPMVLYLQSKSHCFYCNDLSFNKLYKLFDLRLLLFVRLLLATKTDDTLISRVPYRRDRESKGQML